MLGHEQLQRGIAGQFRALEELERNDRVVLGLNDQRGRADGVEKPRRFVSQRVLCGTASRAELWLVCLDCYPPLADNRNQWS